MTRLLDSYHAHFQQHDAQLDYYGKRLATCSSDKTIRIFNVVKGEAKGEPVILKGSVALSRAWIKLISDTPHQYGSCHGLILLSDPSLLPRHMMDESSSGRKLALDSRPGVGASCKMDGRGSRSILCILLVVSTSWYNFANVADSASELYCMGTL